MSSFIPSKSLLIEYIITDFTSTFTCWAAHQLPRWQHKPIPYRIPEFTMENKLRNWYCRFDRSNLENNPSVLDFIFKKNRKNFFGGWKDKIAFHGWNLLPGLTVNGYLPFLSFKRAPSNFLLIASNTDISWWSDNRCINIAIVCCRFTSNWFVSLHCKLISCIDWILFFYVFAIFFFHLKY